MMRWLLGLALLLLVAPAVQAQPLIVTSATLQNAAIAVGGGSTLNTAQASTVAIQITSTEDTFSLGFEASQDGTNWATVTCYPQGSATGATAITTTTSVASPGAAPDRALYRCNVAGFLLFRARIISITHKAGKSITVQGTGFQNPFSLGGVTY